MPRSILIERLYDEHAGALYALLRNLTRAEADTRDLLQEVFVKLAREPRLLDGVREERAFLLRLAHNAAVERFRLAQGHYPDSLTDLAPQYLNPIPHDVIGGEPLHYHRTAGSQFILYSIGWNNHDDGGVVVATTGTTPGANLAQGDWVWRTSAR